MLELLGVNFLFKALTRSSSNLGYIDLSNMAVIGNIRRYSDLSNIAYTTYVSNMDHIGDLQI